jgi:hypothetical protein
MAVTWTAEALAELERRGIEPALVQQALSAPDEIAPGPPVSHRLRYWDMALNREMWLRVRVEQTANGVAILGADKVPVYPDQEPQRRGGLGPPHPR